MAEPIPLRMSAKVAVRLIRQKAEVSDNLILTHHAQERMVERGITFADVLVILRKGMVYLAPYKNEKDTWQAEVEKRMPGGRDAVIVTVIPQGDRLIIRTVMWRDKQ